MIQHRFTADPANPWIEEQLELSNQGIFLSIFMMFEQDCAPGSIAGKAGAGELGWI